MAGERSLTVLFFFMFLPFFGVSLFFEAVGPSLDFFLSWAKPNVDLRVLGMINNMQCEMRGDRLALDYGLKTFFKRIFSCIKGEKVSLWKLSELKEE